MTLTLKDSQTTDNTFNRIGGGTGRTKLSTSFTAGSSYTVASIEAKLSYENSATGNVHCALYSDSSGAPNAVLETSGTSVSVTTLPDRTGSAGAPQGNYIAFAFSTALVSGTKYHIAIYGDGSGDGFGSGDVMWDGTTSATGQSVYSFEGAWFLVSSNEQRDFKTYVDSGGGGKTSWGRSALDGASIEGIKQFNPSLSYHRHPMLSLEGYRRTQARKHREFLRKVERAA